jgi:hypothetical protein
MKVKSINDLIFFKQGRDSVVDITTSYKLDGPEIESWWGEGEIRTHPQRPWAPPSLLYQVSFQGVNQPGRGDDHTPPSSAELTETPLRAFMTSSGAYFHPCR